ncbi:MAG TPA: radical SAM protein [Thermoanaerobaculia bacterium]
MKTESPVDARWIPPLIPELKILERDGRWLCLSPQVPSWIITTRPGALLLRMVDGERTLQEYHEILEGQGIRAPLSALASFFQSAADAKLFGPARDAGAKSSWQDRKLTALYLHLTNRCNLQCSYCYRESSPRLPIAHDSRRFCEMLEYVQPFAEPHMEVTFSGGEPLMHPGFKDVAATAKRLGYTNVLLTNGTLITEPMADFIHDHFVRTKISLDGPNEEIHSLTRGKGNFSQVVRSIEKLAVRKVRVTVQVTLSKSAIPYVDEIKRVLPDVPNVRLVFTPLFPMGRGEAMQDESIDNDEFYSFSQGRDNRARYYPGRRSRSCHAGAGSLSIADTGDVYPCHLFHFKEFHFGNIFHDPFEEIFCGEKIKSYVRSMDVEHNNPTCKACEVRFLCSGGCHGNALYAIGDYRAPDSCCDYLKSTILDNLFRQTIPRESGGIQTGVQASL